MRMSTPKVSVIMSVFNARQYLPETIDSILAQTYPKFEFIIIDDGSTEPGVWQLLKEYAQQDERIRLHKNEKNVGQSRSLNTALKLAQGEYIAVQDGDDVSNVDRLKLQVDVLDKQPEVVFVASEIEFIDANSNHLATTKLYCHPEIVRWHMIFSNYIMGHSQVTFRKEPVVRLGGYNVADYSYALDYELWCRLLKIGQCAIVPKPLLKYRKHDKNFSSSNTATVYTLTLDLVQNNIKSVLNTELSLDEVGTLNRFWLVKSQEEQITSNELSYVDSMLREFYTAFIEREASSRKVEKLLKTTIGKQYAKWVSAPFSRHNILLGKFKMSYYGAKWDPATILIGWARLLRNYLALSLRWQRP